MPELTIVGMAALSDRGAAGLKLITYAERLVVCLYMKMGQGATIWILVGKMMKKKNQSQKNNVIVR